ncbi:MAG TPA: chemotaxis protein CheW [Povalibacter sp.]|uniref:chemotaxis protein CheW n=1 Tax=Povalibacter sp. TaxID=1962978 RepID=UPI002CA66AEC|nr:chemotaxis protein CheW [Povalibacter sp.]HMN46961.1 chemotaxis protein CheW [Povalibacter sp.]
MLKALAHHMPSVEGYRARLATLQGSWDTLSLLSHLSGDATDMGGTREAFEKLTAELTENLAAETHRKVMLALQAKSQIAIDIIVRNLFERTADIGFLSTDDDVRQFLRLQRQTNADDASQTRTLAQAREALRQRFREYVAKYSVYQDVILLSPEGTVLARLEDHPGAMQTRDPLVAEALTTRAAYVETYRRFDLQPDNERSLVYSFRVVDGGRNVGVLCLCFRFEDEVAGIFSQLHAANDWSVFALLDAQGKVIASSDPWQVPVGAPMTMALDDQHRIIRFGGREYLAVTCRTHGFQGYLGPGWHGHAMIPIEHAFARDGASLASSVSAELLEQLRDSTSIFSEGLRRIPVQAEQIQRELNRAVWNGNIRLAQRTDASVHFARVLLWEIGNAGRRTQATFEESITDLQRTVVSAILDDAQLLASLAADILDRNLYERANDGRWWALNATLIDHLITGSPDRQAVTAILQHINSLYTVYHGIVLFDAQREVVAVSNPAHQRYVGGRLSESWSANTLALRSSQEFTVSPFEPSSFYDDRPTLVYGAALRRNSRTAGGIGIVFDAQAQLDSILRDALPKTEAGTPVAGAVSAFVDADRRVIAASSGFQCGDLLPLSREQLGRGVDAAFVADIDGTHYAIGARHTGGYREYRATSLWCVVMIPLGGAHSQLEATPHLQRKAAPRTLHGVEQHGKEQTLDIATFHSGSQWLGLLREQVLESVDGTQLRAVPGSPPWHAGLLMYRDQPVPVIDLARLMDPSATTHGRDVVMIRSDSDTRTIGLRVDDLGIIPAIPVSRLLPMSEAATLGGRAVVDRAVRPENPDDPMLLTVNLEQLMLLTRGLQAPAAKAVHKS